MSVMIVKSVPELEVLPEGTILVDRNGGAVWRSIFGWCSNNGTQNITPSLLIVDGAPLTILYIPGRAPILTIPDPDIEKLEIIATAAAKHDGLRTKGRTFADSSVYGPIAKAILAAIRTRWDVVERDPQPQPIAPKSDEDPTRIRNEYPPELRLSLRLRNHRLGRDGVAGQGGYGDRSAGGTVNGANPLEHPSSHQKINEMEVEVSYRNNVEIDTVGAVTGNERIGRR